MIVVVPCHPFSFLCHGARAVDKLLPLVAYAVGLSLNNFTFHKSAADSVASCHEEEEPFGSMEEMEAQTIGNLLPDEADLFSGATDGLEYYCDAKVGDDAEDFDLFSSVGGMELELDGMSCVGQTDSNVTSEVSDGWGSSNGSLSGRHPYGGTPSRTLVVRNLSSQVEDSELMVLFKVCLGSSDILIRGCAAYASWSPLLHMLNQLTI